MNQARVIALVLLGSSSFGCGIWDTIQSLFSSADEVNVTPPNHLEVSYDELPVSSCSEITHYREEFGLTDALAGTHPGYNGWTTWKYDFHWNKGPVSYSSTGYKCFCNGQVFSTLSTCLNSCPVTLACFVGVCDPGGSSKRTFSSTTWSHRRVYL